MYLIYSESEILEANKRVVLKRINKKPVNEILKKLKNKIKKFNKNENIQKELQKIYNILENKEHFNIDIILKAIKDLN